MKSALLIVGALGAGLVACSQDASRHAASKECAACHMPEFESVTHPIHPGAKPTTCAVCHTQDAWQPSVLRHEWPLTGAHAKADCFSCHRGTPPVFHGTPNACVDCHRSDAAKVTFAAHATFGTACQHCHTTNGWKPSTAASADHSKPQPAPAAIPSPPLTPRPTPALSTPPSKAATAVATPLPAGPPPKPAPTNPVVAWPAAAAPPAKPTAATPAPRSPAGPPADVVTHSSRR